MCLFLDAFFRVANDVFNVGGIVTALIYLQFVSLQGFLTFLLARIARLLLLGPFLRNFAGSVFGCPVRFLLLLLFLSDCFKLFAVEHWGHPDLLEHSAQYPVVHLLRDEVRQKPPHIIEILSSFPHLAIQYAQVERVQLVTLQVILAGLH